MSKCGVCEVIGKNTKMCPDCDMHVCVECLDSDDGDVCPTCGCNLDTCEDPLDEEELDIVEGWNDG